MLRFLLTQLSASLLMGLMTTTVANPMDVVRNYCCHCVSHRSLLTQLSASLLTGLMTTTVANPMDVVKTIMWV